MFGDAILFPTERNPCEQEEKKRGKNAVTNQGKKNMAFNQLYPGELVVAS